jgi:hypothetical protein
MKNVKTKLAMALALAALACGAIAQKMPTSPISLSIVDVAGNLALTQDALEAYKTQNPKSGQQDHLHQGARARTARQDQGPAGRRDRVDIDLC